jgi:hypothetical protein
LYREAVTSEPRSDSFRLRRGESAYSLSEQEAFLAMTLFIEQFASTAGDDLATLAADISVESDGSTLDPAAWTDWLECVKAAKGQPEAAGTWRSMGLPTIER